MGYTVLPIDPESLYQSVTFNAETGTRVLRLRVDLRHLTYTDKWYISVFDAQTGDPYCLYVPVVASTVEINNLTELFSHKEFGCFLCAANSFNPSSEDPNEKTIGEFSIVWGDSFNE